MFEAITISERKAFHSVINIAPMKTLGSRIAHYRNEAKMSQAKLAQACGWASQSRVANYEKDTREPTLEDISLMAKVLRIDPAQLLSNGTSYARPVVAEQSPAIVDERFLVIPQFDIQASMGPGIVVPDHLEIVQQLVIDREWVRQQRLNHTGVPNLAVITGFGDSMEPTFCDGDPLMVDRGVEGMTKDGVYVFSFDNMAHIKRLQHIGPGRVRVISDNRAKYDHWEANLVDISIHARVLIGLNVRKME